MRQRVECADRLPVIRRVAGVDVGLEAEGQVMRAAVAVLAFLYLRTPKLLAPTAVAGLGVLSVAVAYSAV